MKRRRMAVTLALLLGIPAFWFLGVDASSFHEECPDCGYDKQVLQIRLFTLPLYSVPDEQQSLVQRVAADLGAPCLHPRYRRLHLQRRWGLCICACPCINGTFRVCGTPTHPYTEQVRARLKAASRDNPSLGKEFLEKVVRRHDWEYWHRFCDQMWAGLPLNVDPEETEAGSVK